MDEESDYSETVDPFAPNGLHPAWLLVVIPTLFVLLAGCFAGGSIRTWLLR